MSPTWKMLPPDHPSPPAAPTGPAPAPCHLEGNIEGVRHVCNRTAGHEPPHVMELFKSDTPRERLPTFGPTLIATWCEERSATVGRGENTVPLRVVEGHIDTAVRAGLMPPETAGTIYNLTAHNIELTAALALAQERAEAMAGALRERVAGWEEREATLYVAGSHEQHLVRQHAAKLAREITDALAAYERKGGER